MNIDVDTNINGSLVPTTLNNVAHFWQSSAPTTRNDGTALVIGDRFYSTSNSQSWFWNGTYWLSEEVQLFSNPSSSAFAASGTNNLSYVPKYTGIFIEEVRFIYGIGATQDSSNYWNIGYNFATDTNTGTSSTTAVVLGNTQSDSTTNTNYKIFTPLVYVAAATGSTRITQVRAVYTKFGTAGSIARLYCTFRVRDVL